ncbi:radical SAM family heme chaperone HemW [Candidatus Berkiella aquae]|uniref:Heme chaperone HemW n=1 Tax=Candidatus Berkiella aquae TaxID=295108 RepID=A0A0Q9YN22_9GAMM|nr:radical SAM family heme chaperone HemW [Candidatus Berkiella aquae]MCS5712616.1 radical SAM family heme chaperone HemW [Candidatus Berkiella aquae]
MHTLWQLSPLSLYIHFPWCVKKCPYCDFNSHALKQDLPENDYVTCLLENAKRTQDFVQDRSIQTIFMGGGTPSLFSAEALNRLLQELRKIFNFSEDIEITLEANPGTVEQQRFNDYRAIGINRLSLGIQSFNEKHLTLLGRIHNGTEAKKAIDTVKEAGFSNFNCDLMFGLPSQTIEEGLADLAQAIAHSPTHLSWYELTLEPNTYFWHHPPRLPDDDLIISLQEQGQALLQEAGFAQYEISAFSRQQPCRHNVNYWEFGDYLAIGAGGHGKVTQHQEAKIMRYHHFRHPKQYMDSAQGYIQAQTPIPSSQLAFEFMLNALRLKNGVPTKLFSQRTGLDMDVIMPQLITAQKKGWLLPFNQTLCTTSLGYRFLNDVVSLFLPETIEASD